MRSTVVMLTTVLLALTACSNRTETPFMIGTETYGPLTIPKILDTVTIDLLEVTGRNYTIRVPRNYKVWSRDQGEVRVQASALTDNDSRSVSILVFRFDRGKSPKAIVVQELKRVESSLKTVWKVPGQIQETMIGPLRFERANYSMNTQAGFKMGFSMAANDGDTNIAISTVGPIHRPLVYMYEQIAMSLRKET